MRFSMIGRAACIAMLIGGFLQPGVAQAVSPDCSNAQIRQQLTNAAANAARQREQAAAKGWKAPSAFNSLYCGAQMKTIFDAMGAGLGGAVYAMIKSLLTNLINQACASAIAPIQNAASQLCIPFFSAANFNINLGLTGSQSFCNGMQLLSITPVTGAPAGPSSTFTRSPLVP